MRLAILCIISALVPLPQFAWADVPLTFEDLLTEKGNVKFELSVSYANADRQGISTADPITVQTGPTSFITIPTLIGESISNSDATVVTLGLRYGITTKSELYARFSGVTSSQRSSDMVGAAKSNESGFVDAWAGVNYKFKDDDDTPALLGFFEISGMERYGNSSAGFKSAMVGVTAYKAIDPIVFSVTGAYRLSQARGKENHEYRPGNLFLLNPNVAFAVNERVTLSTGLQWMRRNTDRFKGKATSITRTGTDLVLGVAYGINQGNTFNTSIKVNASGRNGAELRASWLYTL